MKEKKNGIEILKAWIWRGKRGLSLVVSSFEWHANGGMAMIEIETKVARRWGVELIDRWLKVASECKASGEHWNSCRFDTIRTFSQKLPLGDTSLNANGIRDLEGMKKNHSTANGFGAKKRNLFPTVSTMPVMVAIFLVICPCQVMAIEDCSDGDQLSQVKCVSRQIQTLDKELNATYRRALESLPDMDPTETRRGREQLRRAQRAWLKYKDENCALIGGLRGGSNLSVSHFMAICEVQTLKERVAFLQQVSEGMRD